MSSTPVRRSDADDTQMVVRPVFSVIIPVRNDLDRLRRCLDALWSQTFPLDRVEIIVVDNGSDVPVTSALPSIPGGIWVGVEPNGGSYAARNLGISRARGSFLAFTDADCLPRPEWLETAWQTFQRVGDRIVLAGRIDVFPAHEEPTAVERYERLFAFPQESYVRCRNFGVTANLIVPASVMREVGSFRKDLHSGGDREWGERCHAAGYSLAYEPEMVVGHPARRSLAQMAEKSRRVVDGLALVHARRVGWALRYGVLQTWYLLKAIVRAAQVDEPSLRGRVEVIAVAAFVRVMHVIALGETMRGRRLASLARLLRPGGASFPTRPVVRASASPRRKPRSL